MNGVVMPILEPDADAMRIHLERMFGGDLDGAQDGLIELAWTASTPDKQGRHALKHAVMFGTDRLDECVAEAVKQNSIPGQNVFIGAALRKPDTPPFGRGEDSDFYAATSLWIDIDEQAAAEQLVERFSRCPPTTIVVTGRAPHIRVQCWWRLDEPIRDADQLRAQVAGLAAHFDGDPSVVNPGRVMRLAGSIAWPLKPGRTRERTEISKRQGLAVVPYMVQTLARYYPSATQPNAQQGEAPAGAGPSLNLHSGVTAAQVMAEVQGGKQWHNGVLRLVGHWITRGWSDVEILGQAAGLTLPGYTVAQTIADMRQMISSGRVKWQTPEPEVDLGAAEKTASPLPLIWFGDVAPSLDASDIVEDVICDAQMSVVYGESNCGKTFFASDMALHLATGTPWRGKAVEAGGVIYVAAEGGFGIRNRVAAYRQARGYDGVEVPFGIVPSSVNLLDPKADTPKLISLIQQAADQVAVPIRLVVIDTLSRAMAGGNENSPEDMGALVINGDKIRQATGAHLMFVHHSGKDLAAGARGHSLLRAATDTEIEVSRQEGADHSVARVMKQREMPVEGEFGFALDVVELGVNRRGKAVTSCVVRPMDDLPDAPRKATKLTDGAASGLKSLVNLTAREGIAVKQIIEGRTCNAVLRDTWRKDCRYTGVTPSDDPSRERVYWHRICQELVRKGKILISGEFVWLV